MPPSEPAITPDDEGRARNWWYRTRTQRLTADRATESLAALLATVRAEAAAAEREACAALTAAARAIVDDADDDGDCYLVSKESLDAMTRALCRGNDPQRKDDAPNLNSDAPSERNVAERGTAEATIHYWCAACQDTGCLECEDVEDRNEDHAKAEAERAEPRPDNPKGARPWNAMPKGFGVWTVEREIVPAERKDGRSYHADVICEVSPTEPRYGEPARTAEENARRIADALAALDATDPAPDALVTAARELLEWPWENPDVLDWPEVAIDLANLRKALEGK